MLPEFSGPPTEILIVGSQHIGPTISDTALQNTLARLIAWTPDLVAVEVLPGEVVQLFHEQGGWLTDFKHGGFPVALKLGQVAQELTGWNRVQAARKAEAAEEPQTRVLAYLAAFEPYNALLHWTPDLELPPELAAGMAELAASSSEAVRLGVKVARTLCHTRLGLLDDFPLYQMPAAWWAEYEAGQQTPEFKAWLDAHPLFVNSRQVSQQAQEAGDYWLVLRYLNSPEGVGECDTLENEANLRLGRAGRAKQADWDGRNLLMAARLRQETGRIPGGRLLFIVGSSHKGPMEAALKALGPDLRIVALSELEG